MPLRQAKVFKKSLEVPMFIMSTLLCVAFLTVLGVMVCVLQVTRWFQLLDADELHDPENPLGELELSVQWIHDPRAKDLSSKGLTILEIVQRTLGEQSGALWKILSEISWRTFMPHNAFFLSSLIYWWQNNVIEKVDRRL